MDNAQNDKRESLKKILKKVAGAAIAVTTPVGAGYAVSKTMQKVMEAKYGVGKSKRQRQKMQDQFTDKAYSFPRPYLSGSNEKTVYNTIKEYVKNDNYKAAKSYAREQLQKMLEQAKSELDKANIRNRIQQLNRWEDL